MTRSSDDIDYRTAFDLAPVGLVLSRQRQITDCNQHLLDMFGAIRSQLVGRSLEVLYPTQGEFERTGERIAAQLNAQGWYADERVMKRVGGPRAGELFWCHVSGRALQRAVTDSHVPVQAPPKIEPVASGAVELF